MTSEHLKADLLAWCRKEREEALKGIEGIQKRGMKLYSQSVGTAMTDITPSHQANLERIVSEMDRLIAELDARNA